MNYEGTCDLTVVLASIYNWPDILTLSTTFSDLSVSRNLFSKADTGQFGASGTEWLNYSYMELFMELKGIDFTEHPKRRQLVKFPRQSAQNPSVAQMYFVQEKRPKGKRCTFPPVTESKDFSGCSSTYKNVKKF